MQILTSPQRPCRKGPAEYFTGTVWIDQVVIGKAPSRMKANRVSFEPGARTAWHTHPVGQALHVLSGTGLVQLKGQPIQQILPGDTVWIEPNEIHWHGAGPGHTMVHFSMQEADDHGVDAVWLDHVTAEEYSAT